MYFVMVVVAALSFSVGGIFMKYSDGLTRPAPALAVLVLFVLGAALQALAMKHSQMSVTYLIVLGLEAVTAFSLGVIFFREDTSWLKVLGVLVIVVGIALLRIADLQAEARAQQKSPVLELEFDASAVKHTGLIVLPDRETALAFIHGVGGLEHFSEKRVTDTHASEHLEFQGRGLRIIVRDPEPDAAFEERALEFV